MSEHFFSELYIDVVRFLMALSFIYCFYLKKKFKLPKKTLNFKTSK